MSGYGCRAEITWTRFLVGACRNGANRSVLEFYLGPLALSVWHDDGRFIDLTDAKRQMRPHDSVFDRP